MDNLTQRMHDEVEVIFNDNVDHVHADILHRYVDEQAERIERQRVRLQRLQKLLAASRTILIYHNILPEDLEL